MPLSLHFIRLFQTSFTWIVTRYLRAATSITTERSFSFSPKERYLFTANHQSRLDPFAVFASFTYREMRAISPTRFMTAGGIYYSFLYPLLVACGCYPTRKKRSRTYDAVSQSIYYLEHKQNVFIFPEGRRTLQADSQPRSGVKRIHDNTGVPLTPILIHLEWNIDGKRRSLRVVYKKGSPITSPETLMEQIYRL